jgi:hypothetical protein
MSTIAEIVANGSGYAGSNGSWRTHTWEQLDDHPGKRVGVLFHYSTLMLKWNADDPSDPEVLDYSTGWGSVSDQGGMNTAFRVLGLWLRFERAGGARIVDTRSRVAECHGREAGKAAGSWVIDGNTSQEAAQRLLEGILDGDPAVMDLLPANPLSGEWADDPTPSSLLAEYDLTEDDDLASEVLDAYETGYSDGVMDEVTRTAQVVLA